jgi:redox-sensitive bicupin YhaK (pirin superfamily)
MNPSATEPVHFLQIWIHPNQKDTAPRYQQQNFARNQTQTLLVSADGRDGSLQILQDVALSRIQLNANQRLDLQLNPQRLYWLQVVDDNLTANTQTLVAGDGLAITAENALQLIGNDKADVLFFDMAA